MKDQTADDWLPPGWKVGVKRRRNGKKDKCYHAPCGELRFNSRAEVTRYLEKCGSKTEEKEKVSGKKPSKKVTVEKAEAEGLPPGWTKEVRITKRARRIRRDPFYIDPVSGYVFRSMKDALRYVETGEIGKLAFKPKEKGSNDDDEDLEEDKIFANEPVTVEYRKVTVNGTIDEVERQIAEHVSYSSEITKEEEMLTSSSTGDQTSLSKHTPDQHKAGVGAELSSLNLSEAKGSEQIGQKDSEEGVQASGNAVGILSHKQCRDDAKDRTEKSQQGKGKTKNKKDVSVPRRASKRLAAVALDPTSELKTTKACLNMINQSNVVHDEAKNSSPGNRIDRASKQLNQPKSSLETDCALDASKSKEPIPATSNVLSSGDALTVNGHVGKSVLPLGNVAISGVHSGKLESDENFSDVPGSDIGMPLADLWTDPCIAFAIQTLTGIPCDTPKISESNSGKVPGIQTTPEALSEREENRNGIVERQRCSIDVPPTGPTIWKEQAGKVEKGHKTDEMAGPSLETPLADIWADPCIEFAIKTLTGAIPVEYGVDNQHGLLQQPIYTPHQSGNHLTLPDIGIDKFSQTDFICQQYNVAGKSMSNEHGIRNPIYNYTHHRRGGERP
ncbi:methyl-CpG-binding domain-containing protein 13-like isoform X1 [Hibiscus syriacus]|uniref:methyl-CpG-binding domain-containing protein 13-like isoform X1 n=2 Tax=Hibiscus syriacus TaxID=106335 RepID=UPI0019217F00|nr:methyl-CpG-binding domain-containing protein 13-like isoform X1 [Hibiscus syriacus]